MATKTYVEMVDDMDNTHSADQTVSFSLEGHAYEIDLSQQNIDKLHGLLDPWIANARRVSGGRGRRPRASSSERNANKLELGKIRAWAAENGHNVSTRGRVSSEIVRAYNEAQAGEAEAPKRRSRSKTKAETTEQELVEA
ncbi:histone-like nucleoid-structuring protein Lsr2 [Mycobacteroides abscessus]|uniref:histone-like nucleoid-structuring protein Lsr2 n=1 Tax=Mycobacteroides abscessus TaxID=36809 RepID=UPI00189696EB|nr:Lsr2 family protein [Mycobacteroides abscessus]